MAKENTMPYVEMSEKEIEDLMENLIVALAQVNLVLNGERE